ncbi:MAG TPA: M56 family metallopeptidase [Rhodanobacteraceae bacterium]|nr:M56 family metallopeptidase [Rhodanobacteraceae bacterium]
MHAIDVLQRLWLATLVSSAALLAVAALRAPWRRAFGAEHACRLWWLPPLALAACLLPHRAAVVPAVEAPARILAMVSLHGVAPTDSTTVIDWPSALLALWIAGALCVLAIAILRQWRYARRLRHAPDVDIALPPHVAAVVRARDDATGPALVGAWRPRIVLPNDFERRYDENQRALILRHESVHALRHDGLAGAFASLLLAAFWFNPLAWWGERRLRRDQELACDAAVLREQPQTRRAYADAMLKTQARAEALPAGSFWPGHPVTERIAMLKMSSPGIVRRRCGGFAAGLLSLGACAAAWAAGQNLPPAQAPQAPASMDQHGGVAPSMTPAREYQLDLKAELVSTKDGTKRDVKRVALSMCVVPGKKASVRMQPMGLDLTVVPQDAAIVGIDIAMLDAKQNRVEKFKLLGRLGESMHAATTGTGSKDGYSVEVTPIAGCPGRLAAAPAKVALPPSPPMSPATTMSAPLAPLSGKASRHAGVAPVAPPPMPPLPPMPALPPMPSSPTPPLPPVPPASTGR